MVHGIIHQHSN